MNLEDGHPVRVSHLMSRRTRPRQDPASSVQRERIADSDAVDDLAVVEILGPNPVTVHAAGGLDDECVPRAAA